MKGMSLACAMAFTCFTVVQSASAEGFGINATRLIYPQGARSITVSVRNTMPALPYLVQATVSETVEGQFSALFTVTPPLFRLEPHSANHIRIAGSTSSLPNDRESVFYFHTRAIPGSTAQPGTEPSPGVSGSVQLGVGKIIKLFYRPAGLVSSSTEAQKGLQFTRVNSGLRVRNPSPYFVSLAGISVAGQSLKLATSEAMMLAPFGEYIYPTTVKNGQVSWKTINDQGGIDAFSSPLL